MYKEYIKKIFVICNCLAIFFMVYVIASSAGYTVLLGDDFTHGVRVGAFHVPFFQYFVASLQYIKEIYLDWQGTYFAMFLQAFLSPINNFGLVQLKIVMILNALLFFAALFGMFRTASGFVLKEKKELHIRLTIFSLILFSILDADVFSEIFFWYSGAVAYSIPFSLALLSLTFFLKQNNNSYSIKKKTVFTVCSAVLLFLAAGGSLAVSGTACYAVLLILVGGGMSRRKIPVRNIVVISVGMIGALINVAAPGNYMRHEQGNDSYQLLQAVKWAVKVVWGEVERLTKETMFGVVLIAMLLMGIYLSKELRANLKAYGIISILALGIGYVTAFPVVFGYGGTEFPNRCYFILDVALILSLLNFAIFIGCCLDLWADLYANKSAWAVLSVVLFSAFLFCPEALSDSALIAVAESNHNGSYKNYYEECVAVYDYLENCPEDDVVLTMPGYIENFECFYFDEDETSWVNVGLAQYYHKNSVKRAAE